MASPDSQCKYDLFLSFSDEDRDSTTLGSFIDHLKSALTLKKLDITTGESGLQAINQSFISIVVFSLNYAKSKRCLQELSQIMERHRNIMGMEVLMVFHDVDRSQVKELGGVFEQQISDTSATQDEALTWRKAITEAGMMHGLDVTSGRKEEDLVIEKIVDYVLKMLRITSKLVTDDYLVGLYPRIHEVIQLLRLESNDVRIVGIVGMGGAGKTTLAKVIYNKIGPKFECKCFLEGVRPVPNHMLQEKFFSSILYAAEGKTYNNNHGGEIVVKEILRRQRSLVVLDDVSEMGQLRVLCGSREWYGEGSRIIITTRDRSLMHILGADEIYEVKTMSEDESLQLFCWHAFKQASPPKGFYQLAMTAVEYCHGIPLALKVLGSSLFCRGIEEWESTLERLKSIPANEIMAILKLMYDHLSDVEKHIFLYISRSFIGKDRNDVTQILKSSGLDAEIALTTLIDKSLVLVDENNKLIVHDLLQRFAREMLLREKSTKRDYIYDVFLSFSGEDTRTSFTSHLYQHLVNAGLKVFMDNAELERGQDISSSLIQAIRDSGVSIVIFSESYAYSKWCLEELEEIMRHHSTKRQTVFPVFYNVKASEVRYQSGTFGEAFKRLLGRTKDKESSWKRLLAETANLFGWDLKNYGTEVELMKDIVEYIIAIVDDDRPFVVANHPVGIESRVQDVIGLLRSGQNGVCILGMQGMRGIGKTTLAKAIYNEIGRNFEGRSFVANVRQVWAQDNGPTYLQEQLLSNILKTRKIRLHNVDLGKSIIKGSLRHKRVLVVLDDVDNWDQLQALCGSREWFGQGSRLIITTTDERLLELLKVDKVHTLKQMIDDEPLELFRWFAFDKESPGKDFIDLSKDIVKYTGGLPLALEVLGSYLFGRGKEEWESVLQKLKRIPNDQIQKKLKISFDGLSDDTEKQIFLDISCFFIGVDSNYATQILNGCGFFAELGLRVLKQRNLVTIDDNNKLRMHDLVRDMGREIIRMESPKFPEDRSRLWFHEEVLDVLVDHMGTRNVEGLALKLPETDKVSLKAKAFKKMKRMRLLQLDHVTLVGDYEYLSRKIRWLHWHGFPSKWLPDSFYMGNLVAADLKYSKLLVFWKKPQLLEKLKVLNLSHSHDLIQTPDFSRLPNLEKLVLKDCPSLSLVGESIGDLKNLLLVSLKDCKGLNNLPRSIYMLKSLETLILSGCSKLDKLEEDIEQMESLTTLMADNTAITRVPQSLTRSKSIRYISICGHEGPSADMFPSLVWSQSSPTDNGRSLGQASRNMSSCHLIEVHNENFHDLSSILSSHLPSPILRIKCQSESHLRQDIARILGVLQATSSAELERRPNSSQLIDMGTSVLSYCRNQVHISGSDHLSSSLWIPMGEHIHGFEERILQGSTSSIKYPERLTFEGEGPSVLFKMPQEDGCSLKGMTLHVTYSYLLANNTSVPLMNVLIINYTKATMQIHKQETLMTPSDDERRAIISDLDHDDEVQVIVLLGRVLAVKKTAVYLTYGESVNG